MSQAVLGARSSVSCWDVVSTQPCRVQRQMGGGMETKRWKEGRRVTVIGTYYTSEENASIYYYTLIKTFNSYKATK